MRTLVLEPAPVELDALIERRRRLGQDRYDEMWEGVLHMNSAPSYEHQRIGQQLAVLLEPLARGAELEAVVGGVNIGASDDYRIPDASLHAPGTAGTWLPSAALALEIVSPGDESRDKLPFYAQHVVEELVIVDPQRKRVEWFALQSAEYKRVERSGLVDLGAAELEQALAWP